MEYRKDLSCAHTITRKYKMDELVEPPPPLPLARSLYFSLPLSVFVGASSWHGGGAVDPHYHAQVQDELVPPHHPTPEALNPVQNTETHTLDTEPHTVVHRLQTPDPTS